MRTLSALMKQTFFKISSQSSRLLNLSLLVPVDHIWFSVCVWVCLCVWRGRTNAYHESMFFTSQDQACKLNFFPALKDNEYLDGGARGNCVLWFYSQNLKHEDHFRKARRRRTRRRTELKHSMVTTILSISAIRTLHTVWEGIHLHSNVISDLL